MAAKTKIGLREVRALGPGETVYDSVLIGFAARRQRTEAVVYWVRYRTASGRQRWAKIGRHGAPWTPEEAREEAKRVLATVVHGGDPAAEARELRKAVTVADLCDQYWQDVTSGRLLKRDGRPKKASTLESDIGRIERHIKPLLGRIPVNSLTRADIEEFMHAVAAGKTARREPTGKKRGLSNVRGGKGVATRTLSLLSTILNYGLDRELLDGNPARKVVPFAEGKRERRLSDAEYGALACGLASAAAKGIWPPALAVVRFLALTGWRSSEALGLRWQEVDQGRRTAVLPDTKSGRSVRPLSHAALDVLAKQPRVGGNEFVYPGTMAGRPIGGIRGTWEAVAKAGGLPGDITPHTLRHSFASLAADLGYSEPTIAALVGHKGQSITARYVHSADKVLLAAADEIARHTLELMGEPPAAAQVVELRRA